MIPLHTQINGTSNGTSPEASTSTSPSPTSILPYDPSQHWEENFRQEWLNRVPSEPMLAERKPQAEGLNKLEMALLESQNRLNENQVNVVNAIDGILNRLARGDKLRHPIKLSLIVSFASLHCQGGIENVKLQTKMLYSSWLRDGSIPPDYIPNPEEQDLMVVGSPP